MTERVNSMHPPGAAELCCGGMAGPTEEVQHVASHMCTRVLIQPRLGLLSQHGSARRSDACAAEPSGSPSRSLRPVLLIIATAVDSGCYTWPAEADTQRTTVVCQTL